MGKDKKEEKKTQIIYVIIWLCDKNWKSLHRDFMRSVEYVMCTLLL